MFYFKTMEKKGNFQVDKKYILEKFPGKGGWTYIAIPDLKPNKKAYFNMSKVNGFIDDLAINDHNLFPFGKDKVLMAVKAEIRKKIGKNEGDWVHLKLNVNQPEYDIKSEFIICLNDDIAAKKTFTKCNKSQQQAIIDWISASKDEEMKVERIVKAIDMLAFGRKQFV